MCDIKIKYIMKTVYFVNRNPSEVIDRSYLRYR